jgi:gluconolactonase
LRLLAAVACSFAVAAECAAERSGSAAAASPVPRIHRLDPRFDALIAPGASAEIILDGHDWTEGPLWNPRDGSLLFSDVPRNAVFQWKAGLGVRTLFDHSGYSGAAPFAGREPGSNGLGFDRDGRLVLCQHGDRAVARRERDGRITLLAQRYDGKRLNSPNDLVVRENGEIWFTDPPFGLPHGFEDPAKELPYQGVYRLFPGGALELATAALEAPNGIGFSPDERTLYVSNARNAQPVWMAFEVRDDGSLGAGRIFAEARAFVGDGEGVPDGLEVDTQGYVFAAGPGGVHVFAPDGSRLGRIETGVPTGNVAFGGADGSVLFIAANHAIARIQTRTRGRTLPAPAAPD